MIDVSHYLASLNQCFPGWGGERMFEWAFRGADFLMDESGDAGSALTHRNVALAGESTTIRVAIMTGSWTLPAARGRGLFSRMIDRSQEVARTRDARLLLAFVTTTNSSCGRLAAAGASMIPTFYCNGSLSRPIQTPRLEPAARFVYSDEEWRRQFLERPVSTRLITSDSWSAVIEDTDDRRRVHSIEGDFDAAVPALGEFFCFTTVTSRAEALAASGFTITNGHLAILPISAEIVPISWHIQNGDRM